ncbi:unnamed protein product [Caenorhabditis auriculariae]|uniref:Uncharacterized protein n=1 Tax=Caenorhabditis auriculariae TaxID=2777116 RepID=A0A8S1H2R4_9PELO|nr:unnamed protein product [Caenorhabditis auriculariae]
MEGDFGWKKRSVGDGRDGQMDAFFECPVRYHPRSTTSSGVHPVTSLDLKNHPISPQFPPFVLGTLQLWGTLDVFSK